MFYLSIKRVLKKIIHLFRSMRSEVYAGESVEIKKELILKYLPVNPRIIDCGAHIGTDSIQWASISGSTVYAFEPLTSLYQRLLENTKTYHNIKCFNVALFDFHGEQEMYVSSGESDASSSLMAPKRHLIDHPKVVFDNIQRVNCTTLDLWAAQNKVDKIDLLWLDMQGAELRTLKASKTILKMVSVIHTEVSLYESYEGVETYSHLKEFLLNEDFVCVKEAIPSGFDMGNVLFVKTEFVNNV